MKAHVFFFLFIGTTLHLSAQFLSRFEKNGKYGFRNAAGQIVVKPEYEYATEQVQGLGGVRKDGLWAVINQQGKLVTDFRYNGGVIDAKGFDLVTVYRSSGLMGVNHYYGLVDKHGQEIIPPENMVVQVLSNELAMVSQRDRFGIVNASGETVLPQQYSKDELKVFASRQPNGIYLENGKWKAFSFDGKQLKKWKYDAIYLEGESQWPVRLNQQWGFVDTLGREVVPPTYDSVGIYAAGVAWVSVAGKKGLINKQGTLVLPILYDRIAVYPSGHYLVFAVGKCGLADPTGKTVVPLKYEFVDQFKEGLAAVQLNGKWGYVNPAGKEAIAPRYDAVLPFSDGMAAVVQSKKIGFIDKAGKLVIAPQFDDVVESFYKGKAIVVKGNTEVYIDARGNEIK